MYPVQDVNHVSGIHPQGKMAVVAVLAGIVFVKFPENGNSAGNYQG